MTLYLVVFISLIASIMWVFIVAHMKPRTKHFFARKPMLFLMLHIPIMFLLAQLGGEGMLFTVGSLCGGIVGQIYLAYWGTTQGLTWSGRWTPAYDPPPSRVQLLAQLFSLEVKYFMLTGGFV
jgi:hypothetical protein